MSTLYFGVSEAEEAEILRLVTQRQAKPYGDLRHEYRGRQAQMASALPELCAGAALCGRGLETTAVLFAHILYTVLTFVVVHEARENADTLH